MNKRQSNEVERLKTFAYAGIGILIVLIIVLIIASIGFSHNQALFASSHPRSNLNIGKGSIVFVMATTINGLKNNWGGEPTSGVTYLINGNGSKCAINVYQINGTTMKIIYKLSNSEAIQILSDYNSNFGTSLCYN